MIYLTSSLTSEGTFLDYAAYMPFVPILSGPQLIIRKITVKSTILKLKIYREFFFKLFFNSFKFFQN